MLLRAIVAVDDPQFRKRVVAHLKERGLLVDTVKKKPGLLWRPLTRESADFVFVNLVYIPSPVEDNVRLLRDLPDAPWVVVISKREDPEERAGLLAAGAEAIIYSGLSEEKLCGALDAIVDKRLEYAQAGFPVQLEVADPRLTDFVSLSPSMQRFMDVVRRVVKTDSTLLILGETGVGKERLARAIHAEGPRSNGPFVAVNCGALPDALLESELFGHEQGAFTGAIRSRRGAFELAHTGTIFLDEIGEMPSHLQVKLLRVLQDYQIQPVGSEKSIGVDVRVMAASNRDLETAIEENCFRKDLYYRLSVVSLTLPPLRERAEDISALVENYVSYLGSRIGVHVSGITAEAQQAFNHYDWPGNVRELINVLERAMLLCDNDEITLDNLPKSISAGHISTSDSSMARLTEGFIPKEWTEKPWPELRREILEQLERAYLTVLLKSTGGRIDETAKRAGIQSRSLFDKMKHYGLKKEQFRPPRAD